MKEITDFYTDRRWCPTCRAYVPYLASEAVSFCVHCGGRVRLYNEEDMRDFRNSMRSQRAHGGRPRSGRPPKDGWRDRDDPD